MDVTLKIKHPNPPSCSGNISGYSELRERRDDQSSQSSEQMPGAKQTLQECTDILDRNISPSSLLKLKMLKTVFLIILDFF